MTACHIAGVWSVVSDVLLESRPLSTEWQNGVCSPGGSVRHQGEPSPSVVRVPSGGRSGDGRGSFFNSLEQLGVNLCLPSFFSSAKSFVSYNITMGDSF